MERVIRPRNPVLDPGKPEGKKFRGLLAVGAPKGS